MSFRFLVMSKTGVRLFEYPINTSEGFTQITMDSVIFSGLLNEINSRSVERNDEVVEELKFGAVQSTFSKDEYNNLYLVLSSETVQLEILKQIHVEIKNLFMNSLERIEIAIDPDEVKVRESIQGNKTEIEAVFNPFYRMWLKKLRASS